MSDQSQTPPPKLHRTPHASLKGERVETLLIAGHTLTLHRPTEPDTLLDDPFVEEAFHADEYLPYWAELWPSAQMLAEAILTQPRPFPPGTRTLEVGCGLGLVGSAAAAAGLDIILTDYDLTALEFARKNALANAAPDCNPTVMPLDWRAPPPEKFPLILGADLLYEERAVEPLLRLLQACLLPDGQAWISDPDRKNGKLFGTRAQELGMVLEARPVHTFETDGKKIEGTLYRLALPSRVMPNG